MKIPYKTIAIVLLILLIVENLLLGWGLIMIAEEEEMLYQCYYDICEDYPDALVEGELCYCYDYDVLGDLVVVETDWMGS